MFRDRQTGTIVIIQLPNLPLLLFLAASAIERLGHPHGRFGTIMSVAALISLLWWALDEAVRGVNPFRRILGVVVGLISLIGAFLR